MGDAWNADDGEDKAASPLDRGLYDCMKDRRICMLGTVCPCLLIGRTAAFVGDECVPAREPRAAARTVRPSRCSKHSLSLSLTSGPLRCSYCACAAAWCCLEMPCCIGAVLRRRLYVAIGYDPPSFAVACMWNHCLCAPCSICQEARLVAAKTRGIELKGAVETMER